MKPRRVPIATAILLALALPVAGQGPAADWRTASTEHFRIHYPVESEAWALRAATRLESIRALVIAEVGYEPPQIVDVFISDPVAEPNGMALPLLGRPRMVLWTSPPEAGSIIGHYADWIELLAVHEETHLVHLLRPSRNPVRRLLPIGPLAVSSPRWVSEGYATVIEGRLTGSGRPNGDLRAAVLRRFATAGKLPSYERLASDREGYLGMSMAYLAGSAYLEWLERRAGPGSLKKLWARMSARTPRSFDDSFSGVFASPEGRSPRDLWDRFRAELSAQAIEIERRLTPLREGELWQDLPRGAGAPALSPSGELLALVREGRPGAAGELVVFGTGEEKDLKDRKDIEDKDLGEARSARDPEDVAAVRYGPPARKVRFRLGARGGRAPSMPRFLGEDAILFVRFEPDLDGFLHPDLFRWSLPTGEVRRITHGADLRDADPSPSGTWAVALRQRHGFSQIVRVDLATGELTPLTPPSIEVIYDAPRLSSDGARLAFLRHAGGRWDLVVRNLEEGAERVLSLPAKGGPATPSSPAWSADGSILFASLGRAGRIDLFAFAVDNEEKAPVAITRTAGAAFAPAPTPDGQAVFYLSLEPQGLDLRRLDLENRVGESLDAASLPAVDFAPAVRPTPLPPPVEITSAQVAAGRPYGLGRLEWMPLLGGSITNAAGNRSEVGVRVGDPLGRFEAIALAGLAGADGAGPRGASLEIGFYGSPVGIKARLFDLAERPSDARSTPRSGLDIDRRGIELGAELDRRFGPIRTRSVASASLERIDLAGASRSADRSRVGFELGAAVDLSRGDLRVEPRIVVRGATGSRTRNAGGALGLALRSRGWGLDLGVRSDQVRGARSDVDRLQIGASPSSLFPWSPERIEVPALPPGALVGTRHEGQRADLTLPELPFHLFYERHRVVSGVDGDAGDFEPWLAFAGIERRFDFGPYPLAGLPAFESRVGAAQILDDPAGDTKGERRGWLVLVWRR